MLSTLVIASLALPSVILASYYLRIFKLNKSLPTVWPTVPLIGDAYQFLYDAIVYLDRCHSSYGPIFRTVLGDRRMVVVGDAVGISAVFKNKTRLLSTHRILEDMLVAIGDVTTDVIHVMKDRLLPLTSDMFSVQAIPKLAPAFNQFIQRYIHSSLDTPARCQNILLSRFVGEALYGAFSAAVFGDTFPLSTYDDFHNLDTHFLDLLSRMPFTATATKRSRHNLLQEIGKYIDRAEVEGMTDSYPESAAEILSALQDLRFSPRERNGLFLAFMWGMNGMAIRASFWLFAYLLNDRDALLRVRDEIDAAMATEFSDLSSLLDASPQSLEGPAFALLNSAVKEALRLSALGSSVRQVDGDMEITLGSGQSFPLQQGEFVMANFRALHFDADLYDDPLEFRVDRFMDDEKARKGPPAPFWPWGSGTHICKGRFMAVYAMKMMVILCMRSLDITAVTSSGQPRSSPVVPQMPDYMSLWQLRTKEPISVQIRARSLVKQ